MDIKNNTRNKKAAISFNRSWVEIMFLLFLFIGLWLSLSSGSAATSYVIIIFCGFLSGRVLYMRRGLVKATYIMVMAGFLIGFAFGSFYADKVTIIVLFIATNIISYYLHHKRII